MLVYRGCLKLKCPNICVLGIAVGEVIGTIFNSQSKYVHYRKKKQGIKRVIYIGCEKYKQWK